MAYIDKENMFSYKQTIATGVSDNIIDFGKPGEAYDAPWLRVEVLPILAAGKSIVVELQTSDDQTFTTPEVVGTYNARVGKIIAVGERLPTGLKRYARLKYTVTGATGIINAGLTVDRPIKQ